MQTMSVPENFSPTDIPSLDIPYEELVLKVIVLENTVKQQAMDIEEILSRRDKRKWQIEKTTRRRRKTMLLKQRRKQQRQQRKQSNPPKT